MPKAEDKRTVTQSQSSIPSSVSLHKPPQCNLEQPKCGRCAPKVGVGRDRRQALRLQRRLPDPPGRLPCLQLQCLSRARPEQRNWGCTNFRDFVIRNLKPWHEFAKKCYVNDVDYKHCHPGCWLPNYRRPANVRRPWRKSELTGWSEHVTGDARNDMRWELVRHVAKHIHKI